MKTLVVLLGIAMVSAALRFLTFDASNEISGEEVYIAEGCIHCHSQFSRPGSLDTEIYGPATGPGESSGRAVLIGNRRQGPDLSSVGLRRSRDWNREHLLDPQLVLPGSRMPSYAHLFAGKAERGEALLDYLSGLGLEKAPAWFEQVQGWKLETEGGKAEQGAALFAKLCQQCHGATGEGDGTLAGRFSTAPTNFKEARFRFAPESLEPGLRRQQLGRIVKYGISGTAMPGHEYLTDEDIADLVSFVSGFSLQPERTK